MSRIVAIYASPRRRGNTATLLKEAVRGATEAGVPVDEIVLRDQKISPCLEIYGCREAGRCRIQDDFQTVLAAIDGADALMFASPIFFYTVSAHAKILMDRCQSRWVKKYWIDPPESRLNARRRNGLFIAAGATRGRKLFDGTLLTVRYFFDVLDVDLWRALCYRQLDHEGDVLAHPDYLSEARAGGRALAASLAPQ
jgi:multimeric flavodoxin WrbA